MKIAAKTTKLRSLACGRQTTFGEDDIETQKEAHGAVRRWPPKPPNQDPCAAASEPFPAAIEVVAQRKREVDRGVKGLVWIEFE